MNPTVKQFRRLVDSAAGMQYRLANGQAGGRNATSTDAALARNVREAQALVSADAATEDAPLCTYLDENPRYAAKWDRVERTFVGLPS